VNDACLKAWPFIAEMMEGQCWPDEVIAADLQWWDKQKQRPGRPTLMRRWGVSGRAVRKAVAGHLAASQRPVTTRKKANNPAKAASQRPVSGQSGATIIEVWTYHRSRWPGLSASPPDYARKAIGAARKHRRGLSDVAFIEEAKLIIDAANDCDDVLFREHIRWEHEEGKPNLAKRIETLCRVARWEKRVEAATEWDRAGRPRQGRAAPKGKTVRLRDMFRLHAEEQEERPKLEVIDAIS